MQKREKAIPESKKRMLKELKELSLASSTVVVSSLKGMPSSQFQKIRKKLRGKASIRVIKKLLMTRAFNEVIDKKPAIKDLIPYLEEGSGIMFSQLDPFELAGILAEEKTAVKAKTGQIAPEDLKVEPGPTDMPAGPMISELSSVGIKVAVENGKIAIKQESTIVKKGDKISEAAAGILSKLEILPFTIGLDILAAYDSKDNKVYANIKIDKAGTETSLKTAVANARALAVAIAYACKETITLLIAKAIMNAKAIEAKTGQQPAQPQGEAAA